MLLPNKGTAHNRWIYPVIVCILGVIGIAGSIYVAFAVHRVNEVHLIDRVNTLAKAINPSDITALEGGESDLNRPEYIRTKELLTSIRAVNHDVRFIYLNGIKEGTLFFYVDSEDPESEDYSPPGQLYEEATPIMYEIFETKQNGFEVSSDRWGGWVSAYAPLEDASGNVLALVGMDIPAKGYISDLIVYSSLPLIFTIIIILLITIGQYVRNRERKYIDQKAEFLSITSHEIRTPLTGIRWAAENLLSQPEAERSNEYSNKIITSIYDNCVGLIGRINNLLSVTAFEAGREVTLNPSRWPLLPLISEITESLKLAASSRQITLKVDSSIDTDTNVFGDREQLRQVFENLISNAVKYSKNGGEVLVSYKKQGSKHLVSVGDQGIGMSKEETEHVFDGYHRTEKARHSQQYGTGLGLYLAKKIAQLHGGNITIDSVPEKGTTFTVVIPDKKS